MLAAHGAHGLLTGPMGRRCRVSTTAEAPPCVACGTSHVTRDGTPCPSCEAGGSERLLAYVASRLPLPPAPSVLLFGERAQGLSQWVERFGGLLVSAALAEVPDSSVDLVIVAKGVTIDDRVLARVLRYGGFGLFAYVERRRRIATPRWRARQFEREIWSERVGSSRPWASRLQPPLRYCGHGGAPCTRRTRRRGRCAGIPVSPTPAGTHPLLQATNPSS